MAKRTLQDNLAKLDAQTKMVKGGKQYTPAVAAEVAGINRGKASMRNEKRPAPKTTSLSKLQKSCK